MDDITTKTVIIATNVLVTLTIVTLLILIFSEFGQIYGIVGDTDISIASKFDNVYSMYNGRVESGIGLLNTIKKYEDDNSDSEIIIDYTNKDSIIEKYNQEKLDGKNITEAEYLKQIMSKKVGPLNFEDKYNVTVENTETGIIKIVYSKINK